jgi:hypothetical protein
MLRIYFYGGPCCGEEDVLMTWRPKIGTPVTMSGNTNHTAGIYIYAGKGRFVHSETQEAAIILDYVKTHKGRGYA